MAGPNGPIFSEDIEGGRRGAARSRRPLERPQGSRGRRPRRSANRTDRAADPLKQATQRRYVRIEDTVYQSIAFRTLPGGAAKLWIDMRTQYRGSNNGAIVATLSVLRQRGWNSTDKLVRATRELVTRGLIAYTRRSGQNQFHRASLFAFTDLDVAANERFGICGARASHLYLQWTPGTSFGQPEPAKRAFRKQVQNHTRIRKASIPDSGERERETVPK